MTIANKYIVVERAFKEEAKIVEFDTLSEAYRYFLGNVSQREIYKRIEVGLVEKEVRAV